MGTSIIDMYMQMPMIEFAHACMASCDFVFVFCFQRKQPHKSQTTAQTLLFPYSYMFFDEADKMTRK